MLQFCLIFLFLMQFKSPEIAGNVLPNPNESLRSIEPENAIKSPHAKESTKINGGIEIPRLQAKHFVSITADRFALPHQCSGTLLNDRWVLTTASHLPLQIDPETIFLTYELIVGAGRKGVNGTMYLVERAVIHPDFDPSTRANNLAMIKSRTPILFNDLVRPVQLSTDYVEDDHPSYVVGYRNPFQTEELLMINVTTMRNIDCKGYMVDRDKDYVTDKTVCTDNNEEVGLGSVDFGAGLISSQNNRLIGVASIIFFYPIGNDDDPSVYLRITSYLDWIADVQKIYA